jgi:hypothetical protein
VRFGFATTIRPATGLANGPTDAPTFIDFHAGNDGQKRWQSTPGVTV